MKKNFLKTKNLAIGYKTKLLSHIDLQAAQGELICLIGKNGSGKTGFLKTLAGILPAHSGDIIFNEVSINKLLPKKRARLISIVMSYKVDVPVKVYDFLRMGGYLHSDLFDRMSDENNNILDEVIADLQLENYLNKPVNQLSDGEHQKVIIGRALVQNTPVLLLDEPTTYLDLENKALTIHLLEKIAHSKNKTIIFSTHDINLMLPKVDKIWLADANQHSINEIKQNKIENIFKSIGLKFDNDCNVFRLT